MFKCNGLSMTYESIKNKLSDFFEDEKLKINALEKWDKIYPEYKELLDEEYNIYTASIVFAVFNTFEQTHSFKQLAKIFEVDAKELAIKVKEVLLLLGDENIQSSLKKGLEATFEKNTSSKLIKEKSITNNKLLSDEQLVKIFKNYKSFLALVFFEKDFLEIKIFLKMLENTLSLAGYNLSKAELEKKFGELFIYLGFEPKKGREPDKFVKIKDRWGNYEPYTLIKLVE